MKNLLDFSDDIPVEERVLYFREAFSELVALIHSMATELLGLKLPVNLCFLPADERDPEDIGYLSLEKNNAVMPWSFECGSMECISDIDAIKAYSLLVGNAWLLNEVKKVEKEYGTDDVREINKIAKAEFEAYEASEKAKEAKEVAA